ncbi:MAG TPA: HD-GYP domain-containing protein [Thiolapillus brandeum]|uniref:HD-GYP domain-containing protein n=1 Tax=Thiolapillus brandeum TaxID=1076588 RepID=A0A831NS14_9GAMM|nr:HD-GYP domain-containing protein [Thiolapillus brandeum]
MPVKKILSEDVEIGMVVSSLDRPWSETPFLFQGFQVRDTSEIEELKKQAEYVYILVPDEEIVMSRDSYTSSQPTSYSGIIGQEHYPITDDAEEELRIARHSHDEISHLVMEIENILRSDQELEMEKIEDSIEFMVDSIIRNPDAYIWLTQIQQYDSYTYRQSLSASVWATATGRELGFPREKLHTLATGTLLMDVGNTALPVELLQKKSRLSHDEWLLIKSHVEKGVQILSTTPGISPDVIDIVWTHHERLDGSGYPGGLRGSQIPIMGQIAGMVNFYVAVTIPRPHLEAISPSQALQMLYNQQGRQFDKALVEKFIQALSTYPSGSLVELSTGEIGVVMSQNKGLRLRPNVILLLNPDKEPYGSYPIINLAQEAYDKDGNPLNIVKTLANGKYGLNVEELSL